MLPVTIAVGGSGSDKKRVGRLGGARGRCVAGDEIALVERKSEPREAVAVADDALERRLETRMAADIADAAMPEAGDIIDQFAHRLAIVDADLIERGIERPVDQDARQPRRLQIGERAPLGVGARRQNDAVDPTLMKRGQDLKLARRVVLGVGKEDHHAEPGAFGLDRADDVA